MAASNDRFLSAVQGSLVGGAVGDAVGVALYCSLKYQNDFTKAVTVAVNHSGDSDSTGAIAGNIAGAWLGLEAIEEKWLRDLELKDTLLEMAGDLYAGGPEQDGEALWQEKYGAYCE